MYPFVFLLPRTNPCPCAVCCELALPLGASARPLSVRLCLQTCPGLQNAWPPLPVFPSNTVWPSGLRQWLKAPFRKLVGSSPAVVTLLLLGFQCPLHTCWSSCVAPSWILRGATILFAGSIPFGMSVGLHHWWVSRGTQSPLPLFLLSSLAHDQPCHRP